MLTQRLRIFLSHLKSANREPIKNGCESVRLALLKKSNGKSHWIYADEIADYLESCSDMCGLK